MARRPLLVLAQEANSGKYFFQNAALDSDLMAQRVFSSRQVPDTKAYLDLTQTDFHSVRDALRTLRTCVPLANIPYHPCPIVYLDFVLDFV